jgi:quercetin dioxygenase-like cupin family protein
MLTVVAGSELVNAATGERIVVLTAPTPENGGMLVADVHVPPGRRSIGEHSHPSIAEIVKVRRGHLDLLVEGRHRVAIPGDEVVIAPGVAHDWWNAGTYEASVRVVACPGQRWLDALASLYCVADAGGMDARGRLSGRARLAYARAFRDVVVFRRLPAWAVSLADWALAPWERAAPTRCAAR